MIYIPNINSTRNISQKEKNNQKIYALLNPRVFCAEDVLPWNTLL